VISRRAESLDMGVGTPCGFFVVVVCKLVGMRTISGHYVLEIKCLMWSSVQDM
jgi:hypothetical protein